MVGTRLHAKFIAFRQGVPPEPGGLKSALLRRRIEARGGARRAFVFVAIAIPLRNFYQRLHLRIVVPEIGALVGRGGMRHGDAIVLVQVFVERAGANLPRHFVGRNG